MNIHLECILHRTMFSAHEQLPRAVFDSREIKYLKLIREPMWIRVWKPDVPNILLKLSSTRSLSLIILVWSFLTESSLFLTPVYLRVSSIFMFISSPWATDVSVVISWRTMVRNSTMTQSVVTTFVNQGRAYFPGI